VKETYACQCGGTLSFNYDAKPSSAWQCDRCDFETSHVRVENGDIHPNTFLPEYGAGKRRDTRGTRFDIYKGMLGRDYMFRGYDPVDKGAMFEHTCGWAVRIGPKAAISLIAQVIERRDCEKDNR
jgi:hypothetical protein